RQYSALSLPATTASNSISRCGASDLFAPPRPRSAAFQRRSMGSALFQAGTRARARNRSSIGYPLSSRANASIAVLVGTQDNSVKIRTKLQMLGFRIEAGVRCPSGLVLSACRQGHEQMARAA